MRSAIIGFVIGALFLQKQAALPSLTLLGLLIGVVIAVAGVLRAMRRTAIRIPLLMTAGAFLGFAWAALFATYYLSNELPKEWEGRDVTVVGTIASLPTYFEQGVHFNFAVERVLAENQIIPVVPSKLALSWMSTGHEEAQTVRQVRSGERWQLTIRLRRPHGNANPYGFDYEAWLLEQNLRATGYVRPDKNSSYKNYRVGEFVWSFGNAVERAREALRDRIYAALAGKTYAGVIVALVIGDQKAISHSDWEIFNRTGVSHLISISGLHITMVAGLFAAAIFGLWRRSFFLPVQLPLLLPTHKAAALAGAFIAFVYVLLAGFGVPAQRTLYMLTVVAVALWSGRITSVSHILCIALGVVIALDPWAVLWPGFWLSFCAVAALLYGSSGRADSWSKEGVTRGRKYTSALRQAARSQYMVTVGLIPLTVFLFGQISLISPVANAIAIPLVSFLVTPLALAGSIAPDPLSFWLLSVAHMLVEGLASGLAWLAALPVAVWHAPIPPWWVFALALIGALWLFAPRGWPVRWLGALGFAPLILNVPAHPDAGEMWVTAFDVGQGMSLLVETSEHRLLYDAGPAYSPEADGGNRVILPYLKARGINSLDAMLISHSDADHSGGALSILQQIPIQLVSSSLQEENPIVKKAGLHRRCQAGQAWTWDGVRFEMLHPTASSYDNPAWKPNARSCTLKITLGDRSILLPGDIEAAQERALIESSPDKLQTSILLAPHHGSGTSSTLPFLKTVRPEIALFQVGYRNRYHHPKPEVFDRYQELGIRRLRSDESGAITLRIGTSIDIAEYRVEQARYWFGK